MKRTCQGCSEERNTERYIGCFGPDYRWETVEYCEACYDAAKANFNGETHSIAPNTEEDA